MSSNPCNYMNYRGGDHKRQTKAAYGRSLYRPKSVGAGLAYGLWAIRPLCL